MKLTLKEFSKYIELTQAVDKKQDDIYKTGLDLTNFLDDYYKINDLFLNKFYNDNQVDIIYDWLGERWDRKIYYDNEENGVKEIRILNTVEQLYNFLEELEDEK